MVFIGQVRNAKNWSSARPNGGYWELRYVRRLAAGGWVDPQNVLAAFPDWRDPRNEWDMLSDWPHIAVDRTDNIHVVWHGTVTTHIFGRDEAFYARRPPAGAGAWGAWNPPQSLHLVRQGKDESYSFAPSLALDPEGDLALAVVFFQIGRGGRYIFDSEAIPVRGGVVAGPPIALSRLARIAAEAGRLEHALSAWFPVAGPRLFRHARGRVWLDVLQTAETPRADAPNYIVYQRQEVTDLLGGPAPR